MARQNSIPVLMGRHSGSSNRNQAQFFVTFAVRKADWLVPYDGGSCESLIQDERGGDPFWIPRACLVSVDQTVEIVSHFLFRREPSPAVSWCYWHDLPLSDSYPDP